MQKLAGLVVESKPGRPVINYTVNKDKVSRIKQLDFQDFKAGNFNNNVNSPLSAKELSTLGIANALTILVKTKQPINAETFGKEYKHTTNQRYIYTILSTLEQKGILTRVGSIAELEDEFDFDTSSTPYGENKGRLMFSMHQERSGDGKSVVVFGTGPFEDVIIPESFDEIEPYLQVLIDMQKEEGADYDPWAAGSELKVARTRIINVVNFNISWTEGYIGQFSEDYTAEPADADEFYRVQDEINDSESQHDTLTWEIFYEKDPDNYILDYEKTRGPYNGKSEEYRNYDGTPL